MAAPLKWSKNSPFQSFLLIGLLFFFLAHFMLLSPSSLEDDFSGMRIIHPKDLLSFLKNEPEILAKEDFLKTTPPAYSLRDSTLFSTRTGKPEFRLRSRKMNVYQAEQIAHLRDPEVLLQEQSTVTASEAIYSILSGKMTFMGNVHTTFPNGTELFSEVAVIETKPFLKITIPRDQLVTGKKAHSSTPVTFTSFGLEYQETEHKTIHLLSSVEVKISGRQNTVIHSDQAEYSSDENRFLFYMNSDRIIEHQFVVVKEPDLDLKSRKLELKLASGTGLEEIIALQDVSFQDRHTVDKETEGTGGKAVYSLDRHQILLSEFPQLYQDRDTVTGDLITYHRDSDTVEVTESNAIYSGGKSESKHR